MGVGRERIGAGLWIRLLAAAGLAVLSLAVPATGALAAPTPPFTQCPDVYLDTGCQYLIDVTTGTNAGQQATVYVDSNQPLIDGSEDTLVGVQNDSSAAVSTLYIGVDGSGDNDFGFDGDGLCNASPPVPAGCPFPGPAGYTPTGYEGPNNTFTATSSDSGTVSFTTPIPKGGNAYFSLEGSPGIPIVAGTSAQTDLVTTTLSDGTNTTSSCTTGLGCGELDETSPIQITDQATLVGPNESQRDGHRHLRRVQRRRVHDAREDGDWSHAADADGHDRCRRRDPTVDGAHPHRQSRQRHVLLAGALFG